MAVHLLGIRHHGPGSAKNVAAFLKELQPDIILVEGPPEAEPLLQWVIHHQMQPPVALLAYKPEEPQTAVFYPFAHFSPEWQALHYGVYNNIPTRFFDLPMVFSFAFEAAEKANETEIKKSPGDTPTDTGLNTSTSISSLHTNNAVEENTEPPYLYGNPFDYLAEISGVKDGEEWWELNIESRRDKVGVFEAVNESVTALRDAIAPGNNKHEQLREAWMRKMVRTAEKEGYQRIAVICGAWHVPALTNMPRQKEDNELLKGLEKCKVETTWVPWTYNRLTQRSGYGAGILSPGWYDHLWHYPEDDGTRWMTKVAGLLRKQNMDTSVAHVIEAVRLANALAALRNHTRAGLNELNEATTTVLGFGDSVLLQIIREELIVSSKMGTVPEGVPKVPLLTDIEKYQKKFRLQPTAAIKELKLDLREENDLAKSTFMHRLKLLGIDWGTIVISRNKGNFKEQWQLLWQPEFSIRIIEKGIWGNTLEEAATNYLSHLATETLSASQLVNLLEQSIPTDLPDSVNAMIARLDTLAATTSDITELMRSVPGLSGVVRYGNVRNTDLSRLKDMFDSIVARVCIGIPLACINIDIEAAQQILDLLMKTDYAINISKDDYISGLWQQALNKIQESNHCNPLISGYCTRLLHDRKALDYYAVEKQLSYYMSATNNPADAAFWFEGFLKSSGTILLLDESLWSLINNWVISINDSDFTELLPVLRRTFSEFTSAERRKLGEKAKGNGGIVTQKQFTEQDFNEQHALKILPVIRKLLGIKRNEV
jgi:hypothetical protein